jgi:RNA polymerase sigma-70 factor (ECF subfamily)
LPSRHTRTPEEHRDGDDLELIAAIQGGDERAFSVLYDRYFTRVHHFANARLRNRADAEEVVQETFTVVFRSADAFGGRSSLLSWIYGIARNMVNNHIRRSRAYATRVDAAENGLMRNSNALDLCTPEERLGLARSAAAAIESLGEVTAWQAEVFEMRHFDDLPIQEIADRMSRSNDAIRSSLCRVKRVVVEAVDPDEERAP